MNTDNELDRIVQGFLEDRVAASPRPAALRDSLAHTAVTPQARRRFLGRWLDRDAGAGRRTGEHDHAPNPKRRNRLMYSTTGVIAALAVLALTVNVIDLQTFPPSQVGTTHVVSTDGSGDFDTIAAAVDAASSGDTISIQPGTYAESVDIDKDLIVSGDGPREDIVVAIPEDGPLLAGADRPIRYAFHLMGADASVGDLTIRGSGQRTIAVVAEGGRPTIHDLSVEFGQLTAWPRSFAHVGGGADATVRDNVANALLEVDASVATVSGNVTTGPDTVNGLVVWVSGAADVEVAGNRLNGVVVEGGTVRIDSNELFAPDACAVDISGAGTTVTAVGNTIRDSESGICASGRATAAIESNDVSSSGTGISLGADGATVSSNEVHANDVGILFRVGSPTVDHNTVTGNRVGLAFGSLPASPLVSDNELCENEVDVEAPEGVDPPPLGANSICR